MLFTNQDAVLMCTGCPGVPAKLKGKSGRTVKTSNKTELTEDDKDLQGAGFGTCLAIPTAPKKCNPKFGKWANVNSKVKIKGKKAFMFPNANPCMAGPGLTTMTYAGQRTNLKGAGGGKEKTYSCEWFGCKKEGVLHEESQEDRFPNRENGEIERPPYETILKFGYPGYWPHPNLRPGVKQMPDPTEGGKRVNRVQFKGKLHSVSLRRGGYKTQHHHIVPIQAMRELEGLANNLLLVGWNINMGHLNGIRLPMYWQDIFWHDLQFHPAGVKGFDANHNHYNTEIIKELRRKNRKWKKFCKEDNPEKLYGEIVKFAAEKREQIISWSLLVYVEAKEYKLKSQNFAYK